MIKGIHQMKNLISIAVSLILIAGCTNINSTGVVGTSSGQVVVANTTNATQTLTQFAYVATSGSTTELTLSLSANTAASGYQPFTNYCAVGNTTNLVTAKCLGLKLIPSMERVTITTELKN
jgi:thiamine pyrophosphokinase